MGEQTMQNIQGNSSNGFEPFYLVKNLLQVFGFMGLDRMLLGVLPESIGATKPYLRQFIDV
uniref:Uncharacterized protein n=1 Tax=Cucumis melo TaxID=3656 RepID=A0A9I9E787_CUCME